MDPRYQHDEIEQLWTAAHTLGLWTRVEQAVATAQAKHGLIPPAAADAIRSHAAPTPSAVAARESETLHDVAAFVDMFARSVGEYGRWVHLGLTSSDVVDTANALRAAATIKLLHREYTALHNALADCASRHHNTFRLARTHGQAAEPITLRHQLLVLQQQALRAVQLLVKNPLPMKLSGPVGTYAYNPYAVEQTVSIELNLRTDGMATQVAGRDYYALYGFALLQVVAACERIALFVRLGAQSDVGELAEGFAPGQKGSSVMPHKHNPVTAEQICGLARVARGLLLPLLETQGALWAERDISNSSVERVALHDLSTLAGYLLRTTTRLVAQMHVHADRMRTNLERQLPTPTPAGQLWFAVRNGADRDKAYGAIQQRISAWAALPDEDKADMVEWENMRDLVWYMRNI